jgi:heat shock protein HslJ
MRKSFALLAVLLSVSVVGCGGSDGSGDDPPAASPEPPAQTDGGPATRALLDGRTFLATDGKGVEITEDVPLEIAFEGRRLSVDAGCNSISGNFSLEGGVIQSFLVSTLMGCPPAQAELEVFVSELFRQEAVTRLSGNELTLRGKNGNSLTLAD